MTAPLALAVALATFRVGAAPTPVLATDEERRRRCVWDMGSSEGLLKMSLDPDEVARWMATARRAGSGRARTDQAALQQRKAR